MNTLQHLREMHVYIVDITHTHNTHIQWNLHKMSVEGVKVKALANKLVDDDDDDDDDVGGWLKIKELQMLGFITSQSLSLIAT